MRPTRLSILFALVTSGTLHGQDSVLDSVAFARVLQPAPEAAHGRT
ncbi:MAG: hypothetical protein ACI8QZ_001372 [Chlamydiales bacterium]|jgi:hypothetical protein